MTKKLLIIISIGLLVLAAAVFFRGSSLGAQALWDMSRGGTWLLPIVSVAALVDSVNPCAFSILLLTIAFLMSIGRLRRDIIGIGGAYILGIFIAYMVIGLGLLGTLHLFSTPHFMAKLGALLLVLMGLINIVNEFFPRFPVKLGIPASAHRKIGEVMEYATLPAALALGVLVGLCEFPCTGGPYVMVIGLLKDSVTFLRGFGYLILYNLIFVLPLAVILGIASHKGLLEKVQAWKKAEVRGMRLWSGVAMVALGILIGML